jgi:phage terminase large subunit-like protein
MWARAGYITATPGNVIDYDQIRRDISGHYEQAGEVKEDENCLSNLYSIKEIGFDSWGAVKLARDLGETDGIKMVEFRQGYKSMSPATKDLDVKVRSRQINHAGHPVLRWCMDNMVVQTDPAENIKPAKDKARERIDGAVATIMALGRAILHFDETSIYEKRGLRSL